MFLATRELRFARGRFALMGGVIALIALLMVVLSGLAAGLVNDGVSSLKSMPVTAFAFDKDTKLDNAFTRSVVDAGQLRTWRQQPGVAKADPLGVGMEGVTSDSGEQIDLAVFGMRPSSYLLPKLSEGHQATAPNEVVLSNTLRSKAVHLGTVLTVQRSRVALTVSGFTDGQQTFGHVDGAFMPLDTWRLVTSGQGPAGPPTRADTAAAKGPYASAIALQANSGHSLDKAAGDTAAHTSTVSSSTAYGASPGFSAEQMTLSMIQVFLYAICALVVGAFFTVWTIQRQHEIAVLRAIGASGRYLLRDGLAQASMVLVACTVVGVVLGIGLGVIIPSAVPFAIEASPVLVAALVTIVCGLVGAGVAVLRIVKIEPITALGGAR